MQNLTDQQFMNRNIRKNFIRYSLIKQLKEHPSREKIKPMLQKFKKSQDLDYFKTDSNIILNHRPQGPKYDKNNNIIPYSFVGPSNLYSESKTKRNYSNNKFIRRDSNSSISFLSRFSRSASKKMVRKSEREEKTPNLHLLNNNSLTNVLKEIKNRIKKNRLNKTADSKNIFSKVPKFIRKNITNQENILTKHKLFNKERERFLKTLLKKTHKNKKKDLLISNSNDYIIKNQTNLNKDKTENIDKKYNSNLWTITLRNPENNGEYERIGYQNVGSITEPRYTLFNMNKVTEYSIPSGYKEKNYKYQNFKNLINAGNLEIKGKNLLDFEAMKELGFKGKKIYYKPNEYDYLKYKEVNKLSKLTEEDKLTNFGNKTYAENFNEKDFYDNQPLNIKFIKSNISSYIK